MKIISLMKTKDYSIFILWFFFVFGPTLDTPLKLFGDVSFILTIILSSFFLLKNHDIKIIQLLSVVFFIFLLALLNTLLFDSENISVGYRAILRPIKACGVIMASVVLVELAFKSKPLKCTLKDRGDHLVFILYMTIVVHALIMLAQFFIPTFKEWVYSFTLAKYQLEHYQMFRMAGLSGGGGAQVSFVQSLGFILGLYLLNITKKNILIYIGNIAIIASVFLSGRSGFLVVFISICFYIMMRFFRFIKTGRAKFSVINLLFLTCLCVGVGLLFSELMTNNEYLNVAFQRTFATIINFQETGVIKDNTLEAMGKMFLLPESIEHLLIGKSSYIENNTYYKVFTDIGYFRLIWAYGVLGLMLHMFFYFLLVKISLINKTNKVLSQYVILIFVMVFIFNVKEIFFFTKMSFQITLLLFFILFYSSRESSVVMGCGISVKSN